MNTLNNNAPTHTWARKATISSAGVETASVTLPRLLLTGHAPAIQGVLLVMNT